MKKQTMKTIILLFVLGLTFSCTSKRDKCIKSMMEEYNYSYDEAKEACDEAAADSMIRR